MKHYLSLMVLMLIIVMYIPRSAEPEQLVHVPNSIVLSQPTQLELFMKAMAQRESNNNHSVVNKFGMMGRYQFDPRTVRGLGFSVDKEIFLRDPVLQDSVMLVYLRENSRELRSLIVQYDGKLFKGIRVTHAGILAAAHLGGSRNVKSFFAGEHGENGRTDANGTSLRNYMIEFGTYKLDMGI